MTDRGRPPRAAERAPHVIRARVTDEELADVTEAAARGKTSISDLIRDALKFYIRSLNTPTGRNQ